MIFFLFFIFPSIIFPLYDTRFETLATKFLCAYEIKDPDALNKNAIFIKEFLLTRGSALSKEPQYYKVFEQLYTVIKLIGVSRDLSDYQKLIFNCNLIGKNQKLTWLSTKKDVFDLLFPIVKKFHKEIMISWHNNIVEKNFIELQNKPENFVYHFALHTEIIRRWHIFGKTENLFGADNIANAKKGLWLENTEKNYYDFFIKLVSHNKNSESLFNAIGHHLSLVGSIGQKFPLYGDWIVLWRELLKNTNKNGLADVPVSILLTQSFIVGQYGGAFSGFEKIYFKKIIDQMNARFVEISFQVAGGKSQKPDGLNNNFSDEVKNFFWHAFLLTLYCHNKNKTGYYNNANLFKSELDALNLNLLKMGIGDINKFDYINLQNTILKLNELLYE